VVAEVAAALGIAEWRAEKSPGEKIARLEALRSQGRKVLMVGDGLNDAPALAAAAVSASPSSAADVSQTAADLIFQGESLGPLVELWEVARQSRRLILQNFALAALYNAVSVPLAMAGLVTPLIAAIAMSSSSLIVTLNALRLGRGGGALGSAGGR
jgi:Cu2+-exporting ATPase